MIKFIELQTIDGRLSVLNPDHIAGIVEMPTDDPDDPSGACKSRLVMTGRQNGLYFSSPPNVLAEIINDQLKEEEG